MKKALLMVCGAMALTGCIREGGVGHQYETIYGTGAPAGTGTGAGMERPRQEQQYQQFDQRNQPLNRQNQQDEQREQPLNTTRPAPEGGVNNNNNGLTQPE